MDGPLNKMREEVQPKKRKMEGTKPRETSRLSAGGVAHISDMRIVLLGYMNAGKSSIGNTILGRQEFGTLQRTAQCVMREGQTAGRHITVVEAPGWWKNHTVEETPEYDKNEIVRSVTLCPPGPHALLLIIRVDEAFNETNRGAVQEHLELLGESVWSHTILLFNGGEWLGRKKYIEKHIEIEGESLQWIVEKCGNRYHVVDNTLKMIDEVTGLLEKIEAMVAHNNGYFNGTQRREERSKDQPPKMSDSGYFSRDSGYRSQRSAAKLRQETFMSKIPFIHEDDIKFDFTEYIGGGSFGSVYKGSYQGTPVAVKNIRMGDCPKSLELVIPLRLSHPHIVKMIAVSRKEEDILIAYEYVHGANLHEITCSQCKIKLNEQDKMWVALEIGMAVEYIHDRDIIHQDIKPANILVCERSKRAYLTDWGLANIRDSLDEFGISASGSMRGPRGAGTTMYMAPELLLRKKRCSTMSDMWSLGLTYLEMFTGSRAWSVNKSLFAFMAALYNQECPDALAELRPHLKKFVEPLLQYKPQSRMNATDLVTRLKSKVDLVTDYGYEW